MTLPWVRWDSNIGTHDKVLSLLGEKDGAKAFVLYGCALGWAGGHATDGRVPKWALSINHGNERLARLLVEHRLWEYDPEGGGNYVIHNFAIRQELAAITEGKRAAAQLGARKANCRRWHGPDCGCWDKPNIVTATTHLTDSLERSVQRSPIGSHVRTNERTNEEGLNRRADLTVRNAHPRVSATDR